MLARKLTPPETDSSQDDRIAYLQKVHLFSDIKGNAEALSSLAALMTERTYSTGQAIIREGENGSEMFLLVEGQVSVYKSTVEGEHYKVTLLKSESHAVFGEGALLDSDSRSATIQADSSCRCYVLDRKHFQEFSLKSPEWALPIVRRIARAVLSRLKKCNEDLSLLYHALVSEIRGHSSEGP